VRSRKSPESANTISKFGSDQALSLSIQHLHYILESTAKVIISFISETLLRRLDIDPR
jgi:hypothetical protein